MALLTLDQVNRVALDEMQHVHEEEITLLNEIDGLADLYTADPSKKVLLEEKLEAYFLHVLEHFRKEELLMEQYGFPAYPIHKAEHDRVLSELNSVVLQWKEEGELSLVVNYLRKTPEWIINHIATMDTVTANFLAQQRVLRG